MNPHDPGFEPRIFEGRYEIFEKLGEGGFGAVHKARQLTTGRFVALKIMRLPDGATRIETRVARFLREAELCAKLHHPNLVQIIDSGQTGDGSLYTVFAYAPGDNLAQVIAREGALSPQVARHLMLQVLDALACAHAEGVVHRDLKPGNVMVVPTGARRNALVLDFGIGTVAPLQGEALGRDGVSRITASGDTLGTPGYAAPEQWRGVEPSPCADLFSWGLVFLECLTGKPAYGGATAAEIVYHLLGPDPVPIPAALSNHPLGDLLRRATQKDPGARNVTAAALLEELEACDLRWLTREVIASGDDIAGNASAPLPFLETLTSQPSTGERRQLTALACQLRALQTAGAAKAPDPEALDDALRAGLGACAAAARAQGGRPAAVLGDTILIYFGYPKASDDDARRAARAALAVGPALAAENEHLAPRALRLEAGLAIHTGIVLAGDFSVLPGASLVTGATPRLASTLAASADASIIVVTPESHALLRASFELTPDAKRPGLHRLLAERPAETPAVTPEGTGRSPLVGRTQELDLLLDRWHRLPGGSGQLVLVTGEPGIGKSRLSRELHDRIVPEPHGFLEARCSPDTQNNALFPFTALLARALGLDADRDASAKIARLEAGLASNGFALPEAMPLFLPLLSLPVVAPYVPLDVSPQRQKTLTLGAIVSLLAAMAEKHPLLLLVEDLHWADPTTLELLSQLVREAPSTPMCVLMTARPEFVPSFPMTGMLQLPLGRLERPQIAAMLGELTAHKSLPEAVVEQVVSRTDGVPLFVEELTRMMVESGALVEREDRYDLSGSLSDVEMPGTLRALFTVRLDRIGRAKETAQWAAALGREFSMEVLSAVSPLGAEGVGEDLERLIGAGLVLRRRRVKDPVGVFKHALVRDAAYESLGRGAQEKVHARIASVLEASFPEIASERPDLLAHHHAAAGQRREAVPYAQRAADQGLQRSAYAEAIAHASKAVEWAVALSGVEKVETELKANGVLTQALMAARGWADPQVKATVDRSLALLKELDQGNPHRVPNLWFVFTYHHVASNRREARAMAEEIFTIAEHSGDQGLRAAAAALLGLSLFMDGDHGKARPVLESAVALYDRERHRNHGVLFGLDSLVLAQSFVAQLSWLAGDSESAFSLAARAIEWAREVNHLPSIAIGLLYGGMVHHLAGDKSTVARLSGEILALSAKHGLPAYEGYAAALYDWANGDDRRSPGILGVLAHIGCKLGLTYYGSLAAETQAERGDLDAALAGIDRCLVWCRENDEHFYEPELHRLRARYEARKDPSAPGVRSSLEQAALLARSQDMPRIEALTTAELLRRFERGEERRGRLDELFEVHPGLRAIAAADHV